MARYAPLLSITAEHAFYADGHCRGMQFSPSAQTQAWLRSVDGVCRETGTGLLVLGTPAPAGADGAAPPWLSWTLHCADARFASVTAGLPAVQGELLVLSCCRAVSAAAEAHAWRLHAGASAGAGEHWPLQWPAVTAELTAQQRRLPPLGLVRVPPPDLASQAGPARYTITFAARAPVWKYCLVGAWSTDALDVVAAGGEPAFGAAVAERLDNGQPVLAFRSVAGIELRERSERRFQLRARSAAADRVLVKRLPVAGADHFARETIQGVPTLVSEIYVHR